MIAFGKNKGESRVTAEFYKCAVAVMRGAEAVGEYVALPRQEAFDIEYWALEEAKLRRMPPEKSLARKVVLVVGAGSGIGVATAHRVAAEGAHVVCADLNSGGARSTADELLAIPWTGHWRCRVGHIRLWTGDRAAGGCDLRRKCAGNAGTGGTGLWRNR